MKVDWKVWGKILILHIEKRWKKRENYNFQLFDCSFCEISYRIIIGNVFVWTCLVIVTRTRARFATRTTIANRTRLRPVNRFAAGNVARFRWLWNTARVSTSWRTGTLGALVRALWWTGVAATASPILTTSGSGARSWSAGEGEDGERKNLD